MKSKQKYLGLKAGFLFGFKIGRKFKPLITETFGF